MLFAGSLPAERDVFDLFNKFSALPVFPNPQLAGFNFLIETAGSEITAKNDRPSLRGDVDKSTGAGRDVGPRRQTGDVDIPFAIDLQKREVAPIKTAALEIGKLIGRCHDGIGV